MALRRRIALALLCVCAAGFASTNASGDGDTPAKAPAAAPAAPAPSPRLTVERLHGGETFTLPVPDLGPWRPGYDAWTTWRDEKEKGRVLVSIDAETGKKSDLVRFLVTKEEEAKDPPEMRGIGRGGPPDMLWAADGEALFVTHRGDVHRVQIATGTRVRMTQTTSPISDVRAAPDGYKVSFVRDHDLWAAVAPTRTPAGVFPGHPAFRGHEIRLTTGGTDAIRHGELDWVYPEELDAVTAAWWSPDSTRIAFLSLDETKVARFPIADYVPRLGAVREQWYPKAGDPNPVPSISVVGLDGKPPIAMDIGKDADVYVPWAVWTPDGKAVLVARLSRSQKRFDLLACDPATGASESILHEEDPAWVDLPPPPRFLEKSPAMIWTTRRDGWWRHGVVEGGPRGAFRALTPAGRDAGKLLAVDEDAGALFYEAWSDDLLHRVVMRVPLSGGEPVRVTDDASSHHASFSHGGRWFTDAASTARVPAKTVLRRGDGTQVRVLGDATTPALAALGLPPPEFGKVKGPGGEELLTVLWKPKDFDPAKRYPVVVETYGGPGAKIVRDEFAGLWSALLCQEGFLVFSLDNRGSAGRGKALEAGILGRLGTLELEDQLAGVAWLRAQPFVDPARIGIWGWSYGGFMTCTAMTRSKAFRAGVAVAPVTDWRLYDTIYTERYMGLPCDNEQGYTESAPSARAKDLSGALLLCHGLSDDNVHVQNTIRMAEALIRARKPFDEMLYPQRAHGIEGADARVHLFTRILEHFKRNL